MSQADKLRLLLLYAASHPEKFDDAERAMGETHGAHPGRSRRRVEPRTTRREGRKPKRGGAAATFRTTKAKRPIVHSRKSEWDLNRFVPAVNALAVALDNGTLSAADFPEVDGDRGAASSAIRRRAAPPPAIRSPPPPPSPPPRAEGVPRARPGPRIERAPENPG